MLKKSAYSSNEWMHNFAFLYYAVFFVQYALSKELFYYGREHAQQQRENNKETISLVLGLSIYRPM